MRGVHTGPTFHARAAFHTGAVFRHSQMLTVVVECKVKGIPNHDQDHGQHRVVIEVEAGERSHTVHGRILQVIEDREGAPLVVFIVDWTVSLIHHPIHMEFDYAGRLKVLISKSILHGPFLILCHRPRGLPSPDQQPPVTGDGKDQYQEADSQEGPFADAVYFQNPVR